MQSGVSRVAQRRTRSGSGSGSGSGRPEASAYSAVTLQPSTSTSTVNTKPITTTTSNLNMDQTPQQQQQQQGAVREGSQARSASGTSTRAHTSSRSSNPDKQISQIEKSVTHLLVATKQLLETLTQWSRSNAQEEEVSDVYVRLGYEFNLACRAFNAIGVETTDLGPVPDLLRSILEDTLSQPASPQALDNYLPRIRDIIINLLQGLKRKQSKLRARPVRDGSVGSVASSKNGAQGPSRQMSTASDVSGVAMTEGSGSTRSERGRDSPSTMETQSMSSDSTVTPQPVNTERSSLRRSIRRDPQQTIPSSDSSSSMSSTTAQNLPVLSPNMQVEHRNIAAEFPHAPPPPPKQDALTALQRGGDLERRASRRFSAYQIQKHLGASPNGVPVIPAAQNSPIPNRGREARESMRAVTSRTSYQPTRQKSSASKLNDVSPSRSGTVRAPQRISEEREEPPRLDTQDVHRLDAPVDRSQNDSPMQKTPDEYRGRPILDVTSPGPQLGATVNGPFSPSKELGYDSLAQQQQQEEERKHSPAIEEGVEVTDKASEPTAQDVPRSSATPPPTTAINLDSSPASVKELTLFLQYKTRIKKFVLPGGYEDLTLARIQLAFIEKFNWHTHSNGLELPEIYIQDPVSGVRHELEDLSDVKDRSVLVLNVEVLDEVKKHFDEGVGGLKVTLEGVRSLLEGQNTMMQRFGDRQLEASKEMARISATPAPRPTLRSRAPTMESVTSNANNTSSARPLTTPSGQTITVTESSLAELSSLRRDIAVLRQTYTTLSADFTASISSIKQKASLVKSAAATAAQPTYEGNAGRHHVNEGKRQLSSDSEALVNRVDNLSDTVEDLRKDVVSRGVRPRPRDLEVLSKEISSVSKDLSRVKDFMRREKPIWTKIWEAELNLVCTERDELTQQEELMGDLVGDLEDVSGVFNLVEEAMKQQSLTGGVGSLRSTSKSVPLDIPADLDPTTAKEGVLDEVRALRPNHEDRLEAIARAERLRARDLEARRMNEFQKEVENFVEEGKLKRTGGMEEVERLRELKDKRAFRENWETMSRIEEEKIRKRAEREARKAAQAGMAAHEGGVVQTEAANGNANGDAEAKENGEHASVSDTHALSVPNGSNDTSQEGDALFQDAPTGMTPQPQSETQDAFFGHQLEHEHQHQHQQRHQHTDDNDGGEGDAPQTSNTAPQLPAMDIGAGVGAGGGRDDDSSVGRTSPTKEKEKERNRDDSWWKPAVF